MKIIIKNDLFKLDQYQKEFLKGVLLGMFLLWLSYVLFKKCPVCPGYEITKVFP